jgi:hypothetical protein
VTTSETAIADSMAAVGDVQPGEDEFPQALIDWLVRIRLLEGVPFSYVVPHEQMLPVESIRFFYLNRNWLDAAIDGALSLGAVGTRERRHLETLYAELRGALDEAERKVWAQRAGAEEASGAAEVVTGFLMRSRLVAGWPALHVRAIRMADGPEEMRLLRVDRLSPAVLLVLVDGVPDAVHIEEPRVAVQFGVDPAGKGRSVLLRNPATGEAMQGREVAVPFRPGAPGVIDMNGLRAGLLAAGGDVLGSSLSSAELGLQLLQYPFRQVFGKTNDPPASVFKATIPLADVQAKQGG